MRNRNKPKADRVLRETVDVAFNHLPAEEELAVFLEMLWEAFQRDRSTALPAFEAIQMIAAHEWGREDGLERVPWSRVEVPRWVVWALALGFREYADARASGRITPLGEAYGIEGGGQGKNTRVTQHATELRDIRLVIGISIRERRGMTVRAAIDAMIDENLTSLTRERVEKIWAKHREKARALKFD